MIWKKQIIPKLLVTSFGCDSSLNKITMLVAFQTELHSNKHCCGRRGNYIELKLLKWKLQAVCEVYKLKKVCVWSVFLFRKCLIQRTSANLHRAVSQLQSSSTFWSRDSWAFWHCRKVRVVVFPAKRFHSLVKLRYARTFGKDCLGCVVPNLTVRKNCIIRTFALVENFLLKVLEESQGFHYESLSSQTLCTRNFGFSTVFLLHLSTVAFSCR